MGVIVKRPALVASAVIVAPEKVTLVDIALFNIIRGSLMVPLPARVAPAVALPTKSASPELRGGGGPGKKS